MSWLQWTTLQDLYDRSKHLDLPEVQPTARTNRKLAAGELLRADFTREHPPVFAVILAIAPFMTEEPWAPIVAILDSSLTVSDEVAPFLCYSSTIKTGHLFHRPREIVPEIPTDLHLVMESDGSATDLNLSPVAPDELSMHAVRLACYPDAVVKRGLRAISAARHGA